MAVLAIFVKVLKTSFNQQYSNFHQASQKIEAHCKQKYLSKIFFIGWKRARGTDQAYQRGTNHVAHHVKTYFEGLLYSHSERLAHLLVLGFARDTA